MLLTSAAEESQIKRRISLRASNKPAFFIAALTESAPGPISDMGHLLRYLGSPCHFFLNGQFDQLG
jgi:hypothetical protein